MLVSRKREERTYVRQCIIALVYEYHRAASVSGNSLRCSRETPHPVYPSSKQPVLRKAC